ncbi:hypothetical protein QOZ80_1BG0058540 [Eleusine coracana subsp. coracana]|nr:hypothetical protein QOZ80_1BG0058540 [Eleusine coracana subsp. coracana]
MATHSVNLLLLFLLSSFISILTPMAARANDEAALLAFKAAAIRGGYGDPLASWNGSANGYCSWEGVRCRGWNQQVVALNLPSRGLTGVLSPAIGNLTSLRILNLTKNEFSGDIPPSLGRLHHLRVLDLSRNTFSGEIPLNLTSCMNLKIMALEHNQLCGRVPSEIGDNLIALGTLLLEYNNLTGAIPSSLGNLSSLVDLELTHNQLEGTIPPSLGNIRGIHFLSLADNNLSAAELNSESLNNPANPPLRWH